MGRVLFITLIVLFVTHPAMADPVMDRINKDQKIRCGYVSYAPASVMDQASGKMTGFTVDIIEEAARRMNLAVEWAYETNWPTIAADLNADKFDLACVTYWSNPTSARHMRSSDPVYYQPVFFVTRVDDRRFDKDIGRINDKSVTASALEGDVPASILRELYPDTKTSLLPQSASFSQVFQDVITKRADVTIAAAPDTAEISKNNPGKLKILIDHPVRLFPCVLLMRPEATQLQDVLNVVIREMQLDGTIKKIMKKYAAGPHYYYLVDLPYSKIEGPKK